MSQNRALAFDHRQDVVLAHQQQFLVVDFEFVARVRAEDHAVAHFDLQLPALAVVENAAFAHGDFDADGDEGVEIGYNLLLGLRSGGRLFDAAVRPFAEARWTEVEDLDPFRLSLGIDVPVR